MYLSLFKYEMLEVLKHECPKHINQNNLKI